ncbi:MAG: Gx transporter family protein, partial [Clostridium sp.]|nr:Gx transporter family protein [Clostridium sp.]
VGVSILGGVGHNVGQLAVATAVLESRTLFYYLPVLLIAGMAAGAVIGILCGRMVKRLVSLPDLR